jgi:THO complex subunit 7
LKRVIKKFHAYASLAAPPIVPPSSSATGTTTLEDAKEAFLVELRAYQLALKKSAMICDAETRQVEEYQREKERIGAFEHSWSSVLFID